MGAEVHGGRVVPNEERLAFLVDLIDEGERMVGHLVVNGFHALNGERSRILNLLPAAAICPTMKHATGSKLLFECRVLRVVRLLRFLLGVQMIEVAEEFVEPVHGRQVFVLVSQMVLAKLARSVAEWLEQLGDGWITCMKSDRGTRHAHFGQAGADWILPGYKCRASRCAALLAIVIGEGYPFVPNAVDVRGTVAHLAAAVVTDVPPANVVTPKNENVWSLWCCHVDLPFYRSVVSAAMVDVRPRPAVTPSAAVQQRTRTNRSM